MGDHGLVGEGEEDIGRPGGPPDSSSSEITLVLQPQALFTPPRAHCSLRSTHPWSPSVRTWSASREAFGDEGLALGYEGHGSPGFGDPTIRLFVY